MAGLSTVLLQRRGLFLRVLLSSPHLRHFDRLIHLGNDDDKRSDNSSERADDFERRLFSATDDSSKSNSFVRELDKLGKSQGTSDTGFNINDSGHSRFIDALGESFDTLSDGMDSKLKKAARTFVYSDEIYDEDYSFRPDVTFRPGTTYTPRDLDLTKPGIPKEFKNQFETTTEEVLKKADFRVSNALTPLSSSGSASLSFKEVTVLPSNDENQSVQNVRFLANFLTEAGIIIKRSHTRISAKAQRRVAREIKTARAFGLMPFTTMGTKPFVFGRSMKDVEPGSDFEYKVGNSDNMDNSDMQGAAPEP